MRAASQPQLCTHREGTRLIPVHGPTHRHMLTHKTRAACRRLRCSCSRNAGVQQPARNFAIASSLCMRRPRGQARMVPPAMHTGRSARAAARRSDAISKRLPQPPRMCCARCCMQPPAVLCGLTAFYADPTSRPPGRPHPADAAHGPLPKRSARARMLTFAAPQAKESSSARRSWPPCPRGDTAEPRPPSRPPAPAPAPRSPLTAASSPMMPPRSTSVASCGLSRAPHSQRLPCPATAENVCTRSAVRVAPHTHARSAAHGSSSLLQGVSQCPPTLLQTCCPCATQSNDSASAAPEGASAGVLKVTR